MTKRPICEIPKNIKRVLVYFDNNKRNDLRHIHCARVKDGKIIVDDGFEYLCDATPTHFCEIPGVVSK